MDKEQLNIVNKLKCDEIKEYAGKLPINNILVFGSLITDEFNEESDVDIAIFGDEKLHIKEVLRLELFLEDLLERHIDVVDLRSETLDLFIKIDILNTGKSIYTTDNNESLERFIDELDWYYKENEHYFQCRKRDLISWIEGLLKIINKLI